MKLTINVKTPKNQAEKTMRRQIQALIGYKKQKDILEQKVINDHEFQIKLYYEKEELLQINKRLWRAEFAIKEFYKTIYKYIKRVNRIINIGNKLGKAGKKGIQWLQKKAAKMLIKEIPDRQQREEMMENLNIQEVQIQGNLFKEIEITDKEDMDKLLAGQLITTKEEE